ncbi:MAG: tRNA (adenosine(37)-N6)-threonylcarbamoyltransferase complex dimerization subunit type 1 TsaB [Solirubrobacterales bacterium]
MRIVGFDTATDDTVVGATVDGETVSESLVPPGHEGRPVHSKDLLAAVTAAAEAAGGWPKVDRIAVGKGPGTFTGIRIGLATANGLGLSTGIDLAGVSTLAALARPMLSPDRLTLALLDARRGEIFAALYGPDGEVVLEPFVCGPDQLPARIEGFGPGLLAGKAAGLLAGGPGAVRFSEVLERSGIETAGPEAGFNHLNASAICERGAVVDTRELSNPLEPTYLRVPDAQLWLERDGRKAGT